MESLDVPCLLSNQEDGDLDVGKESVTVAVYRVGSFVASQRWRLTLLLHRQAQGQSGENVRVSARLCVHVRACLWKRTTWNRLRKMAWAVSSTPSLALGAGVPEGPRTPGADGEWASLWETPSFDPLELLGENPRGW